MAAELDLNPQQRIGFDRYFARDARPHRDDARAEPPADRQQPGTRSPSRTPTSAKITRRFDEAAEKRRRFQHEATAQTLDFLAILSPEQRAKFVAIARERRAPWLRQRGKR